MIAGHPKATVTNRECTTIEVGKQQSEIEVTAAAQKVFEFYKAIAATRSSRNGGHQKLEAHQCPCHILSVPLVPQPMLLPLDEVLKI